MISIQTNVNSLVAQQNLSVTSAFQSKTIAQLTSGYRINQSGDDAAGLAVANKFRSTVAELTQGVANGNDATAQLQIMDGGMSNISMILDRLKTLATQSASGTFTGNRTTVNAEFQNDLLEIDRQAQSIGLNSGGTFARNLDVYLGIGSGSSSLQNGIVTLGLTQSAVDSQALGMKGMQAVNVVYATDGTNTGVSIGSTSTTSVQAIVGNTSGASPNQEATAGYAALQFSGAGFSDAGKAQVSVNLAGVTDTTTLVAAINSAIQTAGNGTTAAATAFKNANIVASVHTDSGGGQELAFSSSTSAFQVQAGDQMANALMGHVSIVGDAAQGTAIAGTTATNVTGATTTDGLLTQGQTVKLVVTGGGLASPVTLQVNTSGGSPVSTSGAITDLETQFSGNALLAAAGLSMSGSSTAGSQLSFASAVGQGFNIQVTGDRANVLGLGSFSADSAGNADYTLVTAGTAYDATAVTGNSKTIGVADGLQVSLNGLAATALTPIDLTAGAHALAASLTSNATITGVAPGNTAGTVDITAANQKLNVTVINNGAVTNAAVSLSTNLIATKGAAISSITGTGYSSTIVSAALLNNSFTVAVDGGTATKITLTDGTYANKTTFLAEVNARLTAAFSGSVTAAWADGAAPGDTLGALTLTSQHVAGVDSTVSIALATTATLGKQVSTLTSATDFAGSPVVVSAATHTNSFMVTVDGGAAVKLTVADGSYATAGTFLTAIQNAVSGNGLTAAWDVNNGNKLTLTSSGTPGASSSVLISQATDATYAKAVSSFTSASDFAGSPVAVSAAAHNNSFTIANDGGAVTTITVADGSYNSAAGFLAAVQGAVAGQGLTAAWDVNNGNVLTLTRNAGTAGAGSSVAIGAATYTTAAAKTSSLTDTGGAPSAPFTTDATHNQLVIAVDGGPSVALTLAQATYTSAGDKATFLADVTAKIGGSALAGLVTATWATSGVLTLTSTSQNGAASTVNVSVAGSNDASGVLGFAASTVAGTTATNTGRANLGLTVALNSGNAALANTGWSNAGLTKDVVGNGNNTAANTGMAVTMGLSAALNAGVADGPASVASIAAQIQTALGGAALVSVSNDYKISIASTTKGANSSVMLNATANSAYATLHLTSPTAVLGLNSSIADVVDNLNAQFAANGTAYQAAGLKAVATIADGTGSGNFITIQSNNGTQFRLNAVGVAAAATAATLSSTVTEASFSVATPLAVTLNTNDKIDVAVNGLVAQTIQVAASSYTTSGAFLTAVNNAIAASVDPVNGLAGKVTAGWDSATKRLTLTSVTTGTAASVTTSATSGNTGLANLGFGTGATSTGQLFSTTENTGFGVAGTTFVGTAPSSTGTAMSAFDAFGTSNSTAFTFSAMKYGSDKQALTFSATDSNGVLETQTITLQNKAGANRAGVSIDTAVAYINQQLQQSTSNPALQKIVAVKEVVGGAEQINFVSSLANFTVGVAATANGDGLNAGVATQKISATNGAGANMSVDTQSGGQAAVTALASAIARLGSAQAAVGKGQNQLSYAVSLAQSQITNFSAAESVIRDANVAQQAANLSKAQVLSQASIAAMAQANSAPQAVLSLLRG